MLTIAGSASAQMTAEDIMGLLPKMPTETEMITFHKEATAPIGDDKTITQPNLYNDFVEALKAAKAKADESMSQVGDADTYPFVGAVGYLEQAEKLSEYDRYLRPQDE